MLRGCTAHDPAELDPAELDPAGCAWQASPSSIPIEAGPASGPTTSDRVDATPGRSQHDRAG